MSESNILSIAITTIFAREVQEASVIIGQYRTVLIRSNYWEGEKLEKVLKLITKSSLIVVAIVVLVVLAVAIPLDFLSQDLDARKAEIIEGVSKVVAAICILQLSLKISKWLESMHPIRIHTKPLLDSACGPFTSMPCETFGVRLPRLEFSFCPYSLVMAHLPSHRQLLQERS